MPYPSDIKFDIRFEAKGDKLFEYAPPPAIDLTALPQLPANWIIEFNAILVEYNKNLAQALDKHIGNQSTYSSKSDLIQSVKIVFCYLTNRLDNKAGAISKGKYDAILSKLTEDIRACTEGFHNRVSEIVASIMLPSSFPMLLHLARESLVLQVGARLTNEVHASNTIIDIAYENNFGVRLRNKKDHYYGTLTETVISDSLKQQFEINFTPQTIPSLLCDQLRGLLEDDGYIPFSPEHAKCTAVK